MSPMPPQSIEPANDAFVSPLITSDPTSNVVVVTGGAGFIGYHTCHDLLSRNATQRVIIIDELNDYYDVQLKRDNLESLTNEFGSHRVEIVIGDLCDEKLVHNVFKNASPKPRAVIHLAARAGVRPSLENPLLYIHSNVQATTILLETCRQFGVTKFVYASSSSVYGGSTKQVFSEEDVVDFPVSVYAATKKTCELLAFTYHHLYQLDCIGLRFFTVYGPRGRPDMAPFKFMDRIARGQTIEQYGNGSSSRDYTYIEDIVQGVLKSLDTPLKGNHVFNLGNGSPVNLSDFIAKIEQLVGRKAQIKYLPEQPGDVPRTCADISKAQKLLGYAPTTRLDHGLRKTWEWYQETFTTATNGHSD